MFRQVAHISSASTRDRDRASTSASNRELEITKKFLHPHHLLVDKVQNRDSASTSTRDRASTSARDSGCTSDRKLEITEKGFTSPLPLSAQSSKFNLAPITPPPCNN